MTQTIEELEAEMYYIRNKDAGYLGNSFIWWGKDSQGYTAYINGAGRYTKEESEKICKGNPEKNIMYKCSDIDARLHLVFDSQDLRNLGTNEPCGWRFGYATNQALALARGESVLVPRNMIDIIKWMADKNANYTQIELRMMAEKFLRDLEAQDIKK